MLYGSPEVTSGGNALKFYASARVELRRREVLGERGIRVRAKVVKNKCAPPHRWAAAQGMGGMAAVLGCPTRSGAFMHAGGAPACMQGAFIHAGGAPAWVQPGTRHSRAEEVLLCKS